jgi:VWFA-related protein
VAFVPLAETVVRPALVVLEQRVSAAGTAKLTVRVADPAGRPVTGLSLGDFEVTTGGRRRQILSAREITLGSGHRSLSSATQTARREVASNGLNGGGRLFVLLADDGHLDNSPEGLFRVRLIFEDFLEELLPEDRAAIGSTIPGNLPSMAVTRAGAQLEQLERLRIALLSRRFVTRGEAWLPTVVRGLCESLGPSQGDQRILVVASEGVAIDLTSATPAANDVNRELAAAIESANRANVRIYAVDPRGRVSRSVLHNVRRHAFLDRLAVGTGGRAVVQREAIHEAASEIIAETSHFYELTYASDPAETDGTSGGVPVHVQVPGAYIKAVSWIAHEAQRDPAVRLRAALGGLDPVSDLPLRATAVPLEPGAAGQVRTALIVEAAFPDNRSGRDAVLQVGTVRVGSGFAVSELGNGIASVEPQSTDEPFRSTWSQIVELPAGRSVLRIGAHSAALGVVGTVHLDVDIPDPSRPAMVGPIIFGWAPQRRATDAPAPSMPGLSFAPTLERHFDRTNPPDVFTRVFWDAKDARAASVTIEVRQLNADGGPGAVVSSAVRFLDGEQTPNGSRRSAALITALPTRRLESGEYLAVASVRVSNGASAERAIGFAVK